MQPMIKFTRRYTMSSTLDIRKEEDRVTHIRVANNNKESFIVELIKPIDLGVELYDDGELRCSLAVLDKKHAKHIIDGLRKAIELNWLV